MDNKSKPEWLDNDPEVDAERKVHEGEPIWRDLKMRWEKKFNKSHTQKKFNYSHTLIQKINYSHTVVQKTEAAENNADHGDDEPRHNCRPLSLCSLKVYD